MSGYNYCDGCGAETKKPLQLRDHAAGAMEYCGHCARAYDKDLARYESGVNLPQDRARDPRRNP
jgi:hypothetical protein